MNTRLSLLMVLALLVSSAWLPGPLHAAADAAPPEALTATEWQAIQDQLALLVAPDGGVDHHFGNSVSVSGDTAVVGAPQADDWHGAAYVFYRDQGGADAWGLVATLTPDDDQHYDTWDFGYSVSVSGDWAVIGSPGSSDSMGDAYIYYRDEGGTDAWGRTAWIHAQFPSDGDRFGHSVSLSADSLAAIVGAPGVSGGVGAAYVFYANYGTLWGTCYPPAGANQFGTSVSVSEYTALVGAPWNLEGQGTAFVCSGSQNSWGVDAELIPADGQQPGDQFGSSVSIHGDTAVVGAPWRYNDGNVGGAAYLFYRDLGGPNTWGQAAKLTTPDDADGGDFGASVSVDGDALAIGSEIGFKGADADNGIQSEAGTAYVFHRDLGGADAWGLAATLNPGEGPWALLFGHSVSVSGDRAVVGVPWAEVNGNWAQGAAYVFSLPSVVPSLTLHLSKLKAKQKPAARPGWHKVSVQGLVHDQDHLGFAGATVEGTWTYPDGSTVPGEPLGPTDARGRFTFRIKEPLCGRFQFDLTDISTPEHVYDPAANDVSPHIEVSVPCP